MKNTETQNFCTGKWVHTFKPWQRLLTGSGVAEVPMGENGTGEASAAGEASATTVAGAGTGDGSTTPARGVYWKRNDTMRLVHVLVDPVLKVRGPLGGGAAVHAQTKHALTFSFPAQPSFIASETGQANALGKQFWPQAVQKFNDDSFAPTHLFPNDPNLARNRSFTPTKKSKEVEQMYLREKYKALKKQFVNSWKRWEETGQGRIENFWKCSGVAPGTTDEGCWYMFLVLHTGKHEAIIQLLLEKSSAGSIGSGQRQTALGGSAKRARLAESAHHDHHDPAGELQMELKMESVFKQQAEVLKFVELCYKQLGEAVNGSERAVFWKTNLATAQAQLVHVQKKLPCQAPPPPVSSEPAGEDD